MSYFIYYNPPNEFRLKKAYILYRIITAIKMNTQFM